MIKKIIKFINEENLIDKNDKILIGLSGGPDSVALVRCLFELKKLYNLDLGFCHINHCLRGDDSDKDEEFCKEMSIFYKVPFYSLKIDLKSYSQEKKIGLEEAGREVRYNFFENILKNNNYRKLALAHNLDDNVETFLFRLFRGTGSVGLKGIPVKRNYIIRPLLNIKKSEILEYLKENKQEFRFDKSNEEIIYSRNKIRLELIPYIETNFNPKFKDSINSLIRDFNYEKIKKVTINKKKSLKELNSLDYISKKNFFYELLKDNNIETSRSKIDEIIKILEKDGYKEMDLGNSLVLKKYYNSIEIGEKDDFFYKKDKIQLDIPDKIEYNGYTIETKIVNKILKEKNHFYFDYEQIKQPLFVRSRHEGDKFLYKDKLEYKKLKKFFIDEKVDKQKRDKIPIVFSDDEILLIGNLRTSKIAILTENSKKILLLKIEEGVFSEQ